MKTCKVCGQNKDSAHFHGRVCLDCHHAANRAKRAAKWDGNPTARPWNRSVVNSETGAQVKICTSCGEAKTLDAYWSKGAVCRLCMSNRRRRQAAERRAQDLNARPYNRVTVTDAGTAIKRCSKCDTEKPTSAFSRDRGRIHSYCRECHNAQTRQWKHDNYAKMKAAVDRWILANPEQYREMRYRNGAKRYARVRGSGTYEQVDREFIIERDGFTCYLCLRKLVRDEIELDHVVPVARGGAHTPDNLRVTCQLCNRRKNDKLLEELDADQFPGVAMLFASLGPVGSFVGSTFEQIERGGDDTAAKQQKECTSTHLKGIDGRPENGNV